MMDSIDAEDPEEFVRENRSKLVQIIRRSDDPFARACAWTLLDRYTPDNDLDTLRDELETVINRQPA